MCPYYLDGDRGIPGGIPLGKSWRTFPPDEPFGSPGDTRYIGYCAVFKVREEVQLARRGQGQSPRAPAASRSLKTQQHAVQFAGANCT